VVNLALVYQINADGSRRCVVAKACFFCSVVHRGSWLFDCYCRLLRMSATVMNHINHMIGCTYLSAQKVICLIMIQHNYT